MEDCPFGRWQFPSFAGEMAAPVGKINMGDVTPLKDWVDVIGAGAKIGRDPPAKLPHVAPLQINACAPGGPAKPEPLPIWKAGVCFPRTYHQPLA